MEVSTVIILGLIFFVFLLIMRTARIVPQKTLFIVERLGQ